MLEKKELSSLVDLSKDIIEHDIEKDFDYIQPLLKSNIFTNAEITDLKKALSILIENENLSESKKVDYLDNLWKINYYEKPPTIQDFLTEEWLGLTAESIFPYIRKTLEDYFDPISQFRHLLLAWPIGCGKSTLSVIAALYCATLYSLLRSPKQYLNIAEAAPIVIALLSFTLEKTHDILTKPALSILSTSSRFEKCRTEEQLLRNLYNNGNRPGAKLYYTTAGEGSVFRIGNLLFKNISDKSALLGLNILMGIVSEINFFIERGESQEYIKEFYWDLRGRIVSRLGNEQFLARTILDSSVSSFENELERYMWFESQEDKTNLFIQNSKWDLQPSLFKVWNQSGRKEVFHMFKGDANKEPCIINKEDLNYYDNTDVIDVPIDLLTLGKNSPSKLIKDFASIPLATDAKLIGNYSIIDDMFSFCLKNNYTFYVLPASQPPEDLLWNLVRKDFFIYTGTGNLYEFYRYPQAERFVSLDLGVNHDAATLSMCHLEKNKKGEKIYVIDMTIVAVSTKEDINLDAFKYLLYDMKKYGKINIKMVSFDQFQSVSSKQFLIRHGIEVINKSVDREVEPYYSVISYMTQGRIKVGRNLFIKNNFKSLINRKLNNGKIKVDHIKTKEQDLTNLNWETSKMGYGAKDATDSLTASILLADLYGTDSSDFLWIDEVDQIQNEKNHVNFLKEELHKKFNLNFKNNDYKIDKSFAI